jgi:hypothetical protein
LRTRSVALPTTARSGSSVWRSHACRSQLVSPHRPVAYFLQEMATLATDSLARTIDTTLQNWGHARAARLFSSTRTSNHPCSVPCRASYGIAIHLVSGLPTCRNRRSYSACALCCSGQLWRLCQAQRHLRNSALCDDCGHVPTPYDAIAQSHPLLGSDVFARPRTAGTTDTRRRDRGGVGFRGNVRPSCRLALGRTFNPHFWRLPSLLSSEDLSSTSLIRFFAVRPANLAFPV